MSCRNRSRNKPAVSIPKDTVANFACSHVRNYVHSRVCIATPSLKETDVIMAQAQKKAALKESAFKRILDFVYEKAVNGVPGFGTAEDLANDYLGRNGNV